ncbi:MAG: hypothetical protein E7159_02280 [Firmicutes bacterium]|nr:hypothetical protein [Bacillota bacterium]
MKIKVSKKDVETFDKSDIGKIKNQHLKRAKIIGVILIMFGLLYILFNIYYQVDKIYEYVTASISILFGIYFIINSNILKKKEVNKYIYNKKSSK